MSHHKQSLGPVAVKLGLVTAAIIVLGVIAEHVGQGYLSGFISWVNAQGAAAPLVFGAVNAVGVALFIPQTLFTLAAGLIFGPLLGAGVGMAGLTAGAAICFLISRHGGQKFISTRFGHLGAYQRLDFLSREHPLKTLALSRTIPVFPIPLLSYLWGLTRVKFWPYLLMTATCPLPETLFLASGGHLVSEGVARGRLDWQAVALLALAGIIVTVIVQVAKKAFAAENEAAQKPGPGDADE